MKHRYIGLITVRLSSSRLPQKALLPIGPARLIDHVIERAKLSLNHGLERVVVCTSTDAADDVFVKIAQDHGVDHYRGSLKDKIDRWRGAAEHFGADYIITIDGDDPFCDPELVAAAIKQLEEKPMDVITADHPDYVCGGFTHGIATRVLQKICAEKASDDTEMTKPYLFESGLFEDGMLQVDPVFKNNRVRLTLDYPEDYEFFQRVFAEMPISSNILPLRDILAFLDSRPDLVAINFFRQNDFRLNQKKLEKLELK